jgi:pSer/pThr/pTyr-binding forkhead associated (FHA) protein
MLSTDRRFRVEDFATLCRQTDLASFREATAGAFLVHRGLERQLHPPQRQWQLTQSAQRIDVVSALAGRTLVFPINGKCGARRRPTEWFATVGRAEENEVVLPEMSVSMFHAVFRRGLRWQYVLNDAGSRNGTFVNGQPVPGSDEGPGVEVAAGDELRFGKMRLTFLLAAHLYLLARRVAT